MSAVVYIFRVDAVLNLMGGKVKEECTVDILLPAEKG
jgi:hypothetical protein